YPGAYIVFTDQRSFSDPSASIHYLPSWPGFSNAGDAVVLKNAEGVLADSLYYHSEWGSPKPGVSIERKDPSAISIDPSNWSLSSAPFGSTPNEINTAFRIDRESPQIRFVRLMNDLIHIAFTEFVELTDLARFRVNNAHADVQAYDPQRGDFLTLSFNPSHLNSEVIVRAENIQDFQGNMTHSSEMPLARRPDEGELVLNEIMYQELPEESIPGFSQSEYIEIANSTDHTLSLEGIMIREAADEEGLYRTIEFADTREKFIKPGEYAIIYPEADDLPYPLSRTGQFFGAPVDINRRALRADRTTLSLVNSGKELFLTDSTGTILDHIHYTPFWHNPNLIDVQGISLERISTHAFSNDPDNWTSSSAEKGGTPAERNSVSSASETIMSLSQGGKLSLQPNPFSPDADGFDDVLNIEYEFDNPDYLLRVRILDRYGRHIRTVANSYRAGLSGELRWDGLTDNGSPNRIGIYVLWMEAYHAASGSRKIFREAFVLARSLD
ncbi:MAG: lamin tail domain-containing protein, partial [Balneolaceae bacterium]|nr:lamin tail domain-containing protein [Balneolaceae bacterium]